MADCYERTTCRLCGDALPHDAALTLNSTPLANEFVRDPGPRQTLYPLRLKLCATCGHVCLSHVVSPGAMFDDYPYRSGTTQSFIYHFERYADACVSRLKLAAGDVVVDIGSNDGTLLRFFRERGLRVMGVEPCHNLTRIAYDEHSVPSINAYFSVQVALDAVHRLGPANLVVANNVFAHVDDLDSFMAGVHELLARDGKFVFEVQYLGDLLSNAAFDNIYHEHLSYHGLRPLIGYLEKWSLELYDVEKVETHGGSLRCWARRRSSGPLLPSFMGAEGEAIARMLQEEVDSGLYARQVYATLEKRLCEQRIHMSTLCASSRASGRTMVGFGAPAKMTTLAYHYGLTATDVAFVVDDSNLKQGMFTPGLHIPIRPVAALEELMGHRPTVDLLLFAWNFATPVMERLAWFRDRGGRFLVPHPSPRFV